MKSAPSLQDSSEQPSNTHTHTQNNDKERAGNGRQAAMSGQIDTLNQELSDLRYMFILTVKFRLFHDVRVGYSIFNMSKC